MAWTKKTVRGMLVATEEVTLASSATYAYTSEIDFIDLGKDASKYITLSCDASAVSGTNVDLSLVGTPTSGTAGASCLVLKDAPGSIADVTNAAKVSTAAFDIKVYPAPYYRIGLLCDANESANTMTVTIIVP
jgi:hypothetical protein